MCVEVVVCVFRHCRFSETVSTLRFADRAKQIKNKPKIQMDPKDAKIAELMDQVESLKAKLKKYEGGGDTGPEEVCDVIRLT